MISQSIHLRVDCRVRTYQENKPEQIFIYIIIWKNLATALQPLSISKLLESGLSLIFYSIRSTQVKVRKLMVLPASFQLATLQFLHFDTKYIRLYSSYLSPFFNVRNQLFISTLNLVISCFQKRCSYKLAMMSNLEF